MEEDNKLYQINATKTFPNTYVVATTMFEAVEKWRLHYNCPDLEPNEIGLVSNLVITKARSNAQSSSCEG